jgi:hypothetical protein
VSRSRAGRGVVIGFGCLLLAELIVEAVARDGDYD